MSPTRIIGAVEIGTSKIVVLAGAITGRSLEVIGRAESTASGVKKGEIVDMQEVSQCAHAAITVAENSAGAEIDGVYLALTGGHLDGFFDRGSITVRSSENVVVPEDLQRAKENARQKTLPAGRVYIQRAFNGFRLDGRDVSNPVNLVGERLEAAYWHVHADERRVTDAIRVINALHLNVADIIVSGVASGCVVASDEDKEGGSLVLDIGRGITDWMLYRKGHVARTGVIGIGGDHFTNDLSMGLHISARHAEKLKIDCGRVAVQPDGENDRVWLVGDLSIGDRSIPRKAIEQILHARAEELFGIVRKEVGTALHPNVLPGGVILTGGGSRLDGIVSLAESILKVPVRPGTNPEYFSEELRAPEYSTVLGLLRYGLTAQSNDGEQSRDAGLLGRIRGLFKRPRAYAHG